MKISLNIVLNLIANPKTEIIIVSKSSGLTVFHGSIEKYSQVYHSLHWINEEMIVEEIKIIGSVLLIFVQENNEKEVNR